MDNLKAVVYGREVTDYQRDLAVKEFEEMREIVDVAPQFHKHKLGINYCSNIIRNIPYDQAVQILKSDITGLPTTQKIAGELAIILIK